MKWFPQLKKQKEYGGLFEKSHEIPSPLMSSSVLSFEQFLTIEEHTITNMLLQDAFYYGVNPKNTPANIYQNLNININNRGNNQAYSAYEICHQAIIQGSVDYSALKYHQGYILGKIHPSDTEYQAINPYSPIQKRPLRDILCLPLKLLYQLHQGLAIQSHFFENKMILSIHGLRDAFQNEIAQRDAFFTLIEEQVQQMVEGKNIWVMDAQDSVRLPESFHPYLKEIQDFAYHEIARICGIPKTRLIGESASGLNATGEYDLKNYENTLARLCESLIYPVIRVADPDFQGHHRVEMSTVNEMVEILQKVEHSTLFSESEKVALKDQFMKDHDLHLFQKDSKNSEDS